MAAPRGTTDLDLEDEQAGRYDRISDLLHSEPWTFQFFQAVRLLERLQPGRLPVGRYVHPSREVVRFCVTPALAFPASQIQELNWPESQAPQMTLNFIGLTGPMGLLPLYYTELIMERVRAKDRTMLAFFDLFNHRIISLFYQAWEKYRFTVAYERGERDRFSHHLLDLIGLGTIGLPSRQEIPDDSLLFYAGLLSLHTRSVTALRHILMDYFAVPVQVEQFVGQWRGLDSQDQCSFGRLAGFSEQVAVGAVVGDEIWDQQSGIRIILGPLTLAEYADFLPDGSAFKPMQAITKFFAGPEIDFELQLILKREEVPGVELGAAVKTVLPQLGWSTWATTVLMQRDPADTILRI